MNKILYYGDNLPVLKTHFQNVSVDLIYLDPPFNSKANYNILFEDKAGKDSAAQVGAFEDTWHWTEETERIYQEVVETAPADVVDMISAFRKFIKKNDMLAYLVMMTIRLVELRRILKSTGSIYLHCDPTASHYLKIVMDTIFGVKNFRNEITWIRTAAHSDAKNYANVSDIILYYVKTNNYTFNSIYKPYDEKYLKKYYKHKDENGRVFLDRDLTAGGLSGGGYNYEWKGVKKIWRCPIETMEKYEREGLLYYTSNNTPRLKQFLDEMEGVPVNNVWEDIPPINSQAAERLGYPTQKPRALLERIIKSSANKDSIILDPFCGCGTTISACESLNKNEGYNLTWLGIDITHLAINLIKGRLYGEYNINPKKDYQLVGEPKDLDGAVALSEQDRYQFQWWALSLVNARPFGDKKKGSDKGVDGLIYFIEYPENKTEKAIVQVKSGKVKSGDIRDLKGVVEREEAAFGIFITLQEPSRDMTEEAASSGFWKNRPEFPKIQILTIENILNGSKVRIPHQVYHSKEAHKVEKKDTTGKLF